MEVSVLEEGTGFAVDEVVTVKAWPAVVRRGRLIIEEGTEVWVPTGRLPLNEEPEGNKQTVESLKWSYKLICLSTSCIE